MSGMWWSAGDTFDPEETIIHVRGTGPATPTPAEKG